MTEKSTVIVYDLDGTLVDTIPDIAGCFNKVLAGRGYPAHPVDAYPRMIGWGLERAAEMALPAGVERETVLGVASEVIRLYEKEPVIDTRVYPGMDEAVALAADRNIVQVVYTNKAESVARGVVDVCFPGGVFERVIGKTDRFPAKPDPAALMAWLGEENRGSINILYIGDSPVDVETAANAGADFVGACWGYRTRKELEEAGAVVLCDTPMDFLEMIKKKDV